MPTATWPRAGAQHAHALCASASPSRLPPAHSRRTPSPLPLADPMRAACFGIACNMNMQRRHASRSVRACLSPQWERLRSTPPGSLPDGASRSCAGRQVDGAEQVPEGGPAGALSLTVRCTLQPRGCLPFKHLDDAPAPRAAQRAFALSLSRLGPSSTSTRPPSSPLQSTRRSARPCVREKPYAALFGLAASRTGSQLS